MEGGVVSAGGSQGATSNVDLTDGDAALTVDISGKASINSPFLFTLKNFGRVRKTFFLL